MKHDQREDKEDPEHARLVQAANQVREEDIVDMIFPPSVPSIHFDDFAQRLTQNKPLADRLLNIFLWKRVGGLEQNKSQKSQIRLAVTPTNQVKSTQQAPNAEIR